MNTLEQPVNYLDISAPEVQPLELGFYILLFVGLAIWGFLDLKAD